uniref:Uncharacterized protein n=1 Tax=Fervidobacterium pennivorans TaxID=93466 RepID=A0A7C4RXT7_FERPE
MIERRGQYLLVGSHEWAWSRRTSGFPVYALVNVGSGFEMQKIGETSKKLMKYSLPKYTVAVVREYVSNLGNRRYYVYIFKDDIIKEYILSEVENFTFEAGGEDQKILSFIREWVLSKEV